MELDSEKFGDIPKLKASLGTQPAMLYRPGNGWRPVPDRGVEKVVDIGLVNQHIENAWKNDQN